MDQEDLTIICQELNEWEMSINTTLKDIVENASYDCNAETASDKIVKAAKETEDNKAEAELKTRDAKKFSTEVDSALSMKEITRMSKEGGDGKITAEHKKSKIHGINKSKSVEALKTCHAKLCDLC